ncbi:hypothetical protein [Enterobacter cloacae]|uniref:hypothetical protein n=1 Tax=Enterobacter cloacae TaxID=550 RepID=UPI002A83E3F1|nr:hypothetical protein [Enterobacter cloacae]
MKLSDIYQMNLDSVENERVSQVKYRAEQFAGQYQAAKATFSDIEGKVSYVRHDKGRTEITPWTGHVYSLSKIRTFIEIEKGVFHHRFAPVRIIVSGYQAKVIIDWEQPT